MKKLICFVVASAFASSALAQSELSELRTELQKHYRAFDATIIANDFNAFIKMFHPSYSEVDAQGKSKNFVEFKEMAKGMFAGGKGTMIKSTVVHAQGGLGGEATAWTSVTFTFSVPKDGKMVPMKMTKRYADTLKLTPNGWRFSYSQELPVDEPWPF